MYQIGSGKTQPSEAKCSQARQAWLLNLSGAQEHKIDKYPPLRVMDTNQFVIKTPRRLPAGGGGAGEND